MPLKNNEKTSGNIQCGSKVVMFCPVLPWNLMDDFENNRATPSMLLQALCIMPSVNSNLSYGPKTAKFGFDPCEPDLWSLTLTFWMDITFVNSNHSWKFHNHTMIATLSKGVTRGQTGGQTDWIIHRAAWSQLKKQVWKPIQYQHRQHF